MSCFAHALLAHALLAQQQASDSRRWRWQDYPHDGSSAFDPYSGNPILQAKVRLRLRPNASYPPALYALGRTTFTTPANLVVSLVPTDFAALQPYPNEHWLLPDPLPDLVASPPWLPLNETGRRALRPLIDFRDEIAA